MTDTPEWLREQGAPELARTQELMYKYGDVPILVSLDKLEKLETYVYKLEMAAWGVINVQGGPGLIELESWEETGPWQDLLNLLREKPDNG